MRRGHNIKVKRDGESSGCSRARMLNARRLLGTAYGPRLLPECTSTNERISPNAPEFCRYVNGVLTDTGVCTM